MARVKPIEGTDGQTRCDEELRSVQTYDQVEIGLPGGAHSKGFRQEEQRHN